MHHLWTWTKSLTDRCIKTLEYFKITTCRTVFNSITKYKYIYSMRERERENGKEGKEVSWTILKAYVVCVCGLAVLPPVFWVIKLSQQTEVKQHQLRERKNKWLAHCLTHWTRTAPLCVRVCACVSQPSLWFLYGKTIFTQHISLWWINRASQFPYNPVLS